MKILFISHYFPPESNAPASRVHSFCRRWVQAGHQVTVITCAPNVPNGVVYEGYRNQWFSKEIVDGIEVLRVKIYMGPNKGTLRRSLSYISFLPSALWRAVRSTSPDIIIATSPQFFCAWSGVWASRCLRRPLVVEIRDIWPEGITAVDALGFKQGEKNLLYRFLEWLEHRLYRAGTKVATVGDGYRKLLLKRGVPDDKVFVVPNGVETRYFAPQPVKASIRHQANAGDDDFLVGYLGTVGMSHGLETIIRAARLALDRGNTSVRFVIVGDGARLDKLKQMATDLQCTNVYFAGRRPKEEMSDWLASVDACLVHLKKEQLYLSVLPSKIFESAAMRKPILLGVEGFAKELVERGKMGISFPPEDEAGMISAIEQLEADRELCHRFGESGREFVLENFDLDDLAERYLNELEAIVQKAS